MFMSYRSELEPGSCYCSTAEFHIYDTLASVDVCCKCGVVVEQVLYDNSEYEFGDDGSDNRSHGVVGYTPFIDDNSTLSKRLQASLMTPEERDARDRMKVVEVVCDAFKIPRESVIFDTTMNIAASHREKIKLSGRKKIAVIVAAFYFACRTHHAARDAQTIVKVCGLDIRMMNFGIKSIREILAGSKHMAAIDDNVSANHTIAGRFVEMLDIDDGVKKHLRKQVWSTIDSLADAFTTGRKPKTVIAAIIVICMFQNNISFDKKEALLIFGVCSQSIDTCMKFLQKEYNLQF
jgi:hypothetical protein